MLIDKYYQYMKERGLNKAVLVPEDMVVHNSIDKEGWTKWHPATSNITLDEIKEIESKYNIIIPKEYIDFISSKQFMDIQIDNYTLYGINDVDTLRKRMSLLPASIVSKGFIPIGRMNNEDYIVLDTDKGEILQSDFDDYKIKNVLFNNFTDFVEYLILQLSRMSHL